MVLSYSKAYLEPIEPPHHTALGHPNIAALTKAGILPSALFDLLRVSLRFLTHSKPCIRRMHIVKKIFVGSDIDDDR